MIALHFFRNSFINALLYIYRTSFPPTLLKKNRENKEIMTQNKYFILHINNSKQTMQCLRHGTFKKGFEATGLADDQVQV